MQTSKNLKKSQFDKKRFMEDVINECFSFFTSIIAIAREPILLLDTELTVIGANDSFCKLFQLDIKDTVGVSIYALGNGQFDIPALRKLLENILPKNTFFKDFEVNHDFPFIGSKSLILNAKQINTNRGDQTFLPQIIILAIEDVTPLIAIAGTLALHVKELASKNVERTKALEVHIERLEREVRLGRK
jgi:two-component system CheB/CheR fusion protein